MHETLVDREKLLAHLRANREKHEAMLREGEVLYREKLCARLQEMADAAAEGQDVPDHHGVQRPQNHLADYDRAIWLISFDTRQEIPLGAQEAQRFILDEWEWHAVFMATMRGIGYVGEQGEYPELART